MVLFDYPLAKMDFIAAIGIRKFNGSCIWQYNYKEENVPFLLLSLIRMMIYTL